MEDITTDQLKARVGQNDMPELIDVREPYEHDEYNLGGRNLPLGEIQSWMNEIDELKDREVVLYCRTGSRSGMAKQFLTAAGFNNVRNLLGGIEAWQGE